MKGKYIVFERHGLEYPVVFPNHFVGHNEVKAGFDEIVSAGFFHQSRNQVVCYGESVTLKKKSRPDIDSALLTNQFFPA